MSEICPVARSCGACPLMDLAPDAQRARKLIQVEQLFRLAALEVEPTFHPARSEVGYRNRIRLRVDDDGHLNFFNPNKSPSCAVLRRELVGVLASLRTLSRAQPELFTPFASAEVRAPDLDGTAGLLLVPKAFGFGPREAEVWREQAFPVLPSEVIVDFRPPDPTSQISWGSPEDDLVLQKLPITAQTFTQAPLFGFVQVNRTINEALVVRVVEVVRRAGTKRAIDLYCGSGNFTLPLAAAGVEVHGIEAVRAAVVGAKTAARLQHSSAQFHEGFAETYGEFANRLSPDTILCDPPRRGLRGSLDWILGIRPRQLVLVSCNPKALVGDVTRLLASGYELESVELFDMFAHTEHVEALAVLKRC